jgi:hypothetical protein
MRSKTTVQMLLFSVAMCPEGATEIYKEERFGASVELLCKTGDRRCFIGLMPLFAVAT